MSIETMKQWLKALEHSHANEPIWKTPHKEAITSLRQAIEQYEKRKPVAEIREDMKGGGYIEWLDDTYFVPGTKFYTQPQQAQKQKQEPWVWQQAAIKIQWGHDMVVADLAIDKDHTVSIYCERDQTEKVEAMFRGKNT
jgi:hypothetical protein